MQMHPLSSLPASLYARAGSKAAHLAALLRLGMPVPDGMVLLFGARERGSPLPPLPLPSAARYAVRSSAGDEDGASHSFAGVHETLLNVTAAGINDAVTSCLSSMEAPTARAYRQAHGLPSCTPHRAVLIQPMLQARTAGVVFTRDPVGEATHLVINATRGLGDGLAAGTVTPTEWHLHRQTLQPAETHPSWADLDLQTLAQLALRIEQHFGCTQDIEWCHDGRQFWILQARPLPQPAAWRFPPPTLEWTRANLREVLPDLTSSQALSTLIDILGTAMRRYYGRLLPSDAEIGPPVHIFQGRPYFNLSLLRHMTYAVGMRPLLVLHGLGHDAPPDAADTVVHLPPWRRLLAGLPDLARIMWTQTMARPTYARQFERNRRFLERVSAMQPSSMSDGDIAASLDEWREAALEAVGTSFAAGSMMGLRALMSRLGASETFIMQQLAAGPKTISAQQGFDLLELAHVARRDGTTGAAFARAFEQFLDTYGHRGMYESDWAMPRYREDPAPLWFSLRALIDAPELDTPRDIQQRQQATARAAWADMLGSLRGWKRWLFPWLARPLLAFLSELYVLRERNRFELVRILAVLRQWHLAIAARFVERGWIDRSEHYFDISMDDVLAALQDATRGPQLRALAAASQARRAAWSRHAMPLTMRLPFSAWRTHEWEPDSAVQPADNAHRAHDNSAVLRGLCVSPGRAEGRVRVLRSPLEFERMQYGEILVAPATDPSWTPLFTMAAGVVVEIGGTLSHASTIAREYGLPALVNVRDATQRLRDGDYVRLDATAGTLEVTSES